MEEKELYEMTERLFEEAAVSHHKGDFWFLKCRELFAQRQALVRELTELKETLLYFRATLESMRE